MQTASSASSTCLSSRSAVECTATVLMPISRHARRMRSAISPRLAIRILLNILSPSPPRSGGEGRGEGHLLCRLDDEQRLVELHRLLVLDEDLADHARGVGLDLVQHLHRLDDAQRLALL